jgi:trimethylamine corrinoid protein
MLSADAMLIATELANGALEGTPGAQKSGSIIVLATVKGDVHDIGKCIVVSLMKANGFTVHDLGRDVDVDRIIEEAVNVKADVVGTSALLTTTMKQ